MRLNRTIAGASLAALCAATLAGCGRYGPKGDAGLPPAPADLAYTRVYPDPDTHGPLKSRAEQKALESDLLAGRKQRRTTRN